MSTSRYDAATMREREPACCPRTLVDCPAGCGRLVLPSQLAHVGGIPDPGIFNAAEYACDACRATVILRGDITAAAFCHFTGGPPEAVERAIARELRERAAGNLPDPDPRPLLAFDPSTTLAEP